MAKTKLNASAHQKLETVNPATSELTSMMMSAFRTKVKSPSVNKLIGKVKMRRTGLRNVFTSARTIATTNAVCKSGILTPEASNQAATYTETVFTISESTIPMKIV